MEKILVSACLLGQKVRYNASSLKMKDTDLNWIFSRFEVISFCPEVSAGLPTPRASAEIDQGTGLDVLIGSAKVIGIDSVDVSKEFKYGAQLALTKCLSENVYYAVLTESSPSCGSSLIYDGHFSGTKKAGEGVTAALLRQNGIRIFNQNSIDQLKMLIDQEKTFQRPIIPAISSSR